MESAKATAHLIDVGKMAYAKNLTAGFGGNLSIRLSENTILITAHKSCLGCLSKSDIIAITPDGLPIENGGNTQRVSTEVALHCALYQIGDYQSIVHLHPPHVLALMAKKMPFVCSSYESALILGNPKVIPQAGPTVSDTGPVVDAFNMASVVFLENHGIVAAGDTLLEAFALADLAEATAQISILGAIPGSTTQLAPAQTSADMTETDLTEYEVFSDSHMARLQSLINNDAETLKLGAQTGLTVKYAIRQNDDGQIYNMHFENGKLVRITNDDEADFINTGKKEMWIHVFNGRIDPFAATSQKKLRLIKGHIGDLAKWYAPFYRIFALWKYAPVKELDT